MFILVRYLLLIAIHVLNKNSSLIRLRAEVISQKFLTRHWFGLDRTCPVLNKAGTSTVDMDSCLIQP